MKRLAISSGAFLGFALVCMSLAWGQQRNLAPAPPAGVSAFLEVGQTYTFRFDDQKNKCNGKVLAKPEGGWVLVERVDQNDTKYLINLLQVQDIH